ncbi:hypothetical protein KDW_07130 [Dictyobacter vulcani]|uniref:OmpR/PhoB-type domain-containing protein n=1 Tax=Dictyobacter vulcani TaxID=2607529 RepID=A0A5J4KK55_9CHLR|nr:hypothetical protein [Dictyobacter vulcani]GER86551.1 hypothetical protein KDW_07130 [Dictyobacter vulcani]
MGSLTRKARYPSSLNDMIPFRLTALLEPGHVLVFNPHLGTLSHLAPGPVLLREQQFTASELCVLIPLLQNYPHYCPYEQLLAHFHGGSPTSSDIDSSRLRLHMAQQEGQWDECVRPMRGVLSRVRLKMQEFGINVVAITETGYMLKRLAQTPIGTSEMPIEPWRLGALV